MHHRDDYDDDDYDRFERRSYAPLPQSGWGIASFVTGLAAGLVALVMVVMATQAAMQNPGGEPKKEEAMMMGIALFSAIGLAFVGALFGVIGLALPQRRKTFAILGTIMNGLIVVGFCGLMALGLMAKQ